MGKSDKMICKNCGHEIINVQRTKGSVYAHSKGGRICKFMDHRKYMCGIECSCKKAEAEE